MSELTNQLSNEILDIGIVQEQLIELGGWKVGLDIIRFKFHKYDVIGSGIKDIVFSKSFASFQSEIFDYDKPAWQVDLINKVKELING